MILILLLCNHGVDISLFIYSWIASVIYPYFLFLMTPSPLKVVWSIENINCVLPNDPL